ncbi:hypothetical protein D3C76_1253190 [compost metagenome]
MADGDLHPRRLLGQLLQQAWHADQLHVVGNREGEALAAARRVEAFADYQALFDLLECGAYRCFQGQGPRRRLHGAADAHQQRVAEQFAQAVQRIAHRRLAEGQALRRAGDIALTQQGIQHPQEVEVEVRGIHRRNAAHHKTKFQK